MSLLPSPTETEDSCSPPDPTTTHSLQLSVTRTWGNRTLPINSPEWRSLRAKILDRDRRTCSSCAYVSPHPKGKGLIIDHRDGDASNNDLTNLRIHCPPCEMIRHCGFAGMKGKLRLARSDMEQVEIVRRTRTMFEESGVIPRIRQVDPLATPTDIGIIDLANRLLDTDRDDSTDEEKGLRGFFTNSARDLFTITMAVKPTNPSDARAAEILQIEESLPWIRFSPELHTDVNKFLITYPPSNTPQSEVAWICVDNGRHPHDDDGPTDFSGLDEAWKAIYTNRRPTTADLDNLATRFNVLGGKWLVFVETAHVDRQWSRIATATHMGTLGISAKVAPQDGSSSHVICVFTRNYMDKNDVDKVRSGLRRLGVKWKIKYKPDIYTHCRVYSRNVWEIPPTRYFD